MRSPHPLQKRDGTMGKADRKAAGRVVASPKGGPQEGDRILQFNNGWLDMILQGSKVAEVRGTAAKQGGTWLGKKGVITGWADICKIQVLTSKQDLKNAEHLHRVQDPGLIRDKKIHLWFLRDVQTVGAFILKP